MNAVTEMNAIVTAIMAANEDDRQAMIVEAATKARANRGLEDAFYEAHDEDGIETDENGFISDEDATRFDIIGDIVCEIDENGFTYRHGIRA